MNAITANVIRQRKISLPMPRISCLSLNTISFVDRFRFTRFSLFFSSNFNLIHSFIENLLVCGEACLASVEDCFERSVHWSSLLFDQIVCLFVIYQTIDRKQTNLIDKLILNKYENYINLIKTLNKSGIAYTNNVRSNFDGIVSIYSRSCQLLGPVLCIVP